MSDTQRLIWPLSVPIPAEVNSAMQELTEADDTTSEQIKDISHLRIKIDMKDTKTILQFMEPEIHLVKILTLEAL